MHYRNIKLTIQIETDESKISLQQQNTVSNVFYVVKKRILKILSTLQYLEENFKIFLYTKEHNKSEERKENRNFQKK